MSRAKVRWAKPQGTTVHYMHDDGERTWCGVFNTRTSPYLKTAGHVLTFDVGDDVNCKLCHRKAESERKSQGSR